MKFQLIFVLPAFGQVVTVLTPNGVVPCLNTPKCANVVCPYGTSCRERKTPYTCPTTVCEPNLPPGACAKIVVNCFENICNPGHYCREIQETNGCLQTVCIKNPF